MRPQAALQLVGQPDHGGRHHSDSIRRLASIFDVTGTSLK